MFEQSLKAPQDQVLAVPAAAQMGSPSRFLAFLVASNTLLLYSPSLSSQELGKKYKSQDTTFLQESCGFPSTSCTFPSPARTDPK